MPQKGLLWLIGLLLLLPTSDSQQSQGRPAPTTYAKIARLTFSDADNKPFSSVAISGDRVVVGSFYGVAAVFQANTHQVVKLSAADVVDQEADRFGRSVAIDGNTVVVGACDGEAAYVFRTSDGGATYGQVAKLTASDGMLSDRFGISVAIDGDTVVVGALGDDDGGSSSGSVYVFEKSIWGTYSQVAKLTAADAAAYDRFGSSVAIDGNTIVVGASFDDDAGSASGSVYVFEKSWLGSTYGQVAKLTASDSSSSDVFGISVAIDGGTIVAGARGHDYYDYGAAYVFRTTDGWTTHTEFKLTAADAGEDDHFGCSVAIDGNTVVVGAYDDINDAASQWSSAHVFRTDDGGATYVEVAKLTPEAEYDGFGVSVAISGETVVVGAYRKEAHRGAAYVYRPSDDGATYSQVAKLVPADAANIDKVGWSVAIDGGTVVVGAPEDDDGGSESGSAYVFEDESGWWDYFSSDAATRALPSAMILLAAAAVLAAILA